jgi:protein dithiol oxidoreductase (disulfide-forming)
MRQVFAFVSVLSLCAFTALAQASPAYPKNGVEYLTLPEVQATESGNKVEVTEFFAYYCPHCHAFEPALNEWVKQQGERIIYKRVHVQRGPQVAPQQRLFYTLDALGLLTQYHTKVFEAMHGPARNRLNSDELVFDWADKNGIERTRFIEAYRSFGVGARVRRADALTASYRVDSWPMLAVDGRFLTSPYQASSALPAGTEAQQQQAALQVLDHLVAKAAAERK